MYYYFQYYYSVSGDPSDILQYNDTYILWNFAILNEIKACLTVYLIFPYFYYFIYYFYYFIYYYSVSGDPSLANSFGVGGFRGDLKHRTIVCRHFLLGLCQNGYSCGYLHRLDKKKMPACKHGNLCKIKNCLLKHTDELEISECVFYKQVGTVGIICLHCRDEYFIFCACWTFFLYAYIFFLWHKYFFHFFESQCHYFFWEPDFLLHFISEIVKIIPWIFVCHISYEKKSHLLFEKKE